jgi:hypothetical protein
MQLTDHAYDLLMEGLQPLPLKDNKAPLLDKGHNYLYELVKEDDIQKLFEKAQKIGIACGKVSDGFYCLDFDKHNGEPIDDIYNSYISLPYIKDLLSQGKLSIYSTAGGGYHIYFIYRDEVLTGECFAYWQTKSVMIEIRGNGQYAACWPSTALPGPWPCRQSVGPAPDQTPLQPWPAPEMWSRQREIFLGAAWRLVGLRGRRGLGGCVAGWCLS